jgi:hypothetical protein
VTSYADMARQGEPSGYRIEVRGLQSLSEANAERERRRIVELKPGMVCLLMRGKWEPDYYYSAILEEGTAV